MPIWLRRFAVVVLFWSYVWLLALVGAPLFHPLVQEQQEGSSQQQSDGTNPAHKPDSESFWVKLTSDPTALFTGVVGVFTIVLAVATIGLLAATARSVSLARAEFNATHRAKIRILYLRYNDRDDDVILNLTVVNVGDTDARIVSVGHRFMTVDTKRAPTEIEMPLTMLDIEMKSGVLSEIRIVSSLEEDIMKRIAVSQGVFDAGFACVGHLQYVDASGIPRRTGFCYKLGAHGIWTADPTSDYAYEY